MFSFFCSFCVSWLPCYYGEWLSQQCMERMFRTWVETAAKNGNGTVWVTSRFFCFSVCVGRVSESWQLIYQCSWETTVHLLSQHFSTAVPLALQLVKERLAPTTQAALDIDAGLCACDSKEVLMSLYAQSLSGTMSTACGEGFGGVNGSVDCYSLWSRYLDRITHPWISASAGYMELIKLWPTLVHLHSPARSDQ